MGFGGIVGQATNDIGMISGHIVPFADVGFQVIKFVRRIALIDTLSERFPIAAADGLLHAIRWKLPVEIIMLALFALVEQRRRKLIPSKLFGVSVCAISVSVGSISQKAATCPVSRAAMILPGQAQ